MSTQNHQNYFRKKLMVFKERQFKNNFKNWKSKFKHNKKKQRNLNKIRKI